MRIGCFCQEKLGHGLLVCDPTRQGASAQRLEPYQRAVRGPVVPFHVDYNIVFPLMT